MMEQADAALIPRASPLTSLKTPKHDSFPWTASKSMNHRESVQLPCATSDAMNHPDLKLVLITDPELQNAMWLWLKHLAAHLWKPMFFNDTLVIKWVPLLFRHKTTREDKTMCLIYGEAAPTLSFHAISYSLSFPSLSVFFSPIPFSHSPSQNEPLMMSLANLWFMFLFPVHLSVVSPQPSALSLSLFLSPLPFIINSCDAAQQSLSEWYTSTTTNKPKYLHSAGMICIDEDREGGRARWG